MAKGREQEIMLPFEFSYSDGGVVKTEMAVTVRAPSFEDFKVHNTMVGYAKAAQVGVAVAFSKFARPEARATDVPGGDAEPVEIVETEAEMADRVLSTYAAGLGEDKFSAFMEYLRGVLTNNARLACVTGTKIPIRDKVWQSISEAGDKEEAGGGMQAITIICAAFAGFFLTEQRSKSAARTGENSSTTSPSDRVLQ